MHCSAALRTSLMGSTTKGATEGRMRCAASSGPCLSAVATRALSAATRAGGKVSFSARVKALSRTRLQAASPRCLAMLPSRTVVLARMPGFSSTCSLARYLSSELLSVRCVSLGASVSMERSVSSRRYSLLSVKPLATSGKIWSSHTFSVRCGPNSSMFSSSDLRMARSWEVKSRVTMGMTRAWNSSASSVLPIFRTADSAMGGAPPYSSARCSIGRNFCTHTGCGKDSRTLGSLRKYWSFSELSFTERFSRNATDFTRSLRRKPASETSLAGFSRREGWLPSSLW
mmetsp:Transcript_19663/g.50330  ORF Transcript_19663/g.50330 Transcript_19663/m.50330 type:complete len:286 (+) Transcript_19663:623-1480(+)